MKNIVNKLDGYLHALRRLAKENTDYWATHLTITGTLNRTLQDHFNTLPFPKKIKHIEKINYDAVELIFDRFIKKNLNVNEEQLDLLLWDIVEYYGLASTALDPNGAFNPFVSQGAYRIYLEEEKINFHEEYVYFACPIQDQVILTGFGFRA